MFLFTLQLAAQPKIEKSEIFREPLSDGWTKLLLLKNGNTFYFHYGGKKGIQVIVFDKNKKKVATQSIKSDNWNVKKRKLVKICGLYEINNQPVIFLQYFGGKSPVLYRIQINPSNGSLVKEDVIGSSHGKAANIFILYSATDQEYYVEKDPESDNYAIISYNGRSRDLSQRIKIMHFDGDHKMVNHASYKCPDRDFKILNFIGAVVDGSKNVYMVTYGAKTDKGTNGHVYLAKLTAGDTTLINKPLDFTEDFMRTNSDIVFDRKNNRLTMLTNTLAEQKKSSKNYVSFISYIDPDNLSLKGVDILGNEKVNAFAHKSLGPNVSFNGLPQKLVLNPDNSLAVLQEEITITEIHSGRGGGTVHVYSTLGNIGITEFGPEGTEKAGYEMMKKQLYDGRIDAMYMAGWQRGRWNNGVHRMNNVDNNMFMSYEYIHTDNADYVLFNDNPKNDKEKKAGKKKKLTSNTDYINTICYSIKDGETKRTYLFGEPEGKRNTRACYIECSDYNRKTNMYTTVVSEQHGRKYESRMAWIKFD